MKNTNLVNKFSLSRISYYRSLYSGRYCKRVTVTANCCSETRRTQNIGGRLTFGRRQCVPSWMTACVSRARLSHKRPGVYTTETFISRLRTIGNYIGPTQSTLSVISRRRRSRRTSAKV